MRKYLHYALVIVSLLIMISYLPQCSDDPQPPQPLPAPTDMNQANQSDPKTKSDNKELGVWPFLVSNPETKTVVSDFTARNFIIVFDGSGSMGEIKCSAGLKKIDAAKIAVIEWAKTVPAKANIGLVAFHNDGWAFSVLGETQRAEFVAKVQSLSYGGKTPLSQAMEYAFQNLSEQGRKQLGYGEYTIVVVTDGIANSPERLSMTVKKILDISPINIYTIGFCIGEKHSLNQPGKTIYKAADNPEELKRGLQEVLAESVVFDDSAYDTQ